MVAKGYPRQTPVRQGSPLGQTYVFYAAWVVRHQDRGLQRLCDCHRYSKLTWRRTQNVKLSLL